MKEQWAKDLIVRGERTSDLADISEINRLAFGREDEARLVEDVRKSKNYEFGFSIVAVKEDVILGHALFSKAFVVHKGRRFKCLALGPIAVLPEHQRNGIGKALIEEGFERAKEVGFGAVVVIGDPIYFGQFGFKPATVYKIRCSFNKIPDNFLVKEISRNALRGIIGTVQYAKEFLTLAQADAKRDVQRTPYGEEKTKEDAKINDELLPLTNVQSENIPITGQAADTKTEKQQNTQNIVETNIQDINIQDTVAPLNEQEIQITGNIAIEEKADETGKNTGEIESLI